MQPFTISAKNLAALNMPGVDLRAFWYLMHLDFKHPWNIFPRIFNSFDAHQKRMTRLHMDQQGVPPASFGPFADAERYVKVGKLQLWDKANNIIIRAIPDDVFELADGSLAVIDYKTGRYSKGQDALLPLYEAQLSIYTTVLEALGKGDVAKAGLIYFEPVTDGDDESVLKAITKKGFRLDWLTRPVPIDIDRENVASLLTLARKLFDMSTPPACKDPDCFECASIDAIYALCRSVAIAEAAAAGINQDALIRRAFRKHQQRQLDAALAPFSGADGSPTGSLWQLWDWGTTEELQA